jgi:lysophospholipase L1-like esterase
LKIDQPPFSADAIERINRAGEFDPNGLCHYRDDNKKLASATKQRVVFLGDSVTEYWKLGAPDLFTGDIVNRGVSGQTTSQMLLRFRSDVIDLKPAVVHILAGVNDMLSPIGTLHTRSNLQAMVEFARTHGVKVILGTITPATRFWMVPNVELGPKIREHNAWLKRYAASEKIAFVDYTATLGDNALGIREELSNDGLHPNRNGYSLMTPLARAAINAAQPKNAPTKRSAQLTSP